MPPATPELPPYTQETRFENARRLLLALNLSRDFPHKFGTRGDAEDFVNHTMPRSFRAHTCIKFADMRENDVIRNAVEDCTSILHENKCFIFEEAAMPYGQEVQKSFRDGLSIGLRRQVEERLMDTTRSSVRTETKLLCEMIEKRILEVLEEKLAAVIKQIFANALMVPDLPPRPRT